MSWIVVLFFGVLIGYIVGFYVGAKAEERNYPGL